MSTITMHGVDEEVDRRIRDMARAENTSINRTAQSLLRRALGLDVRGEDHRAEFQDFAGQWSEDELTEFEAATGVCSRVDPEDWK